MIRATRVLVAVAFGYLLFGISGEQFMALQESYAWSIGESINTNSKLLARFCKHTLYIHRIYIHPVSSTYTLSNLSTQLCLFSG